MASGFGWFNASVFDGNATDDLDRDGLSALLEHALGSSDESFDGPPVALEDGVITLRRNLNAADTLLLLIHSANLQDWFEIPESPVISSSVGSDGTWTIRYNVLPLQTEEFFQLEATKD